MATPYLPENFSVFPQLIFLILTSYVAQIVCSDVHIPDLFDGLAHKIFTAADIAKYDGSDPSLPIYMGVKGFVFDVSKGKDFYDKGSAYNALVGKDSSRATALVSLEPENLTHDLTGLTEKDLENLDVIFKEVYLTKYPVVGYMDYLAEKYPEKFKVMKVSDEL